MFNDQDTYAELREQLAAVRQRVDLTVERLADAKNELVADGLDGAAPAGAWVDDLTNDDDGAGSLVRLCGRLDAAMSDATRLAAELARRLRQLAEGAPLEWPPRGSADDAFRDHVAGSADLAA